MDMNPQQQQKQTMNNLALKGYCNTPALRKGWFLSPEGNMKITVAVSKVPVWKDRSSEDLPEENHVLGQQHTGTSMGNTWLSFSPIVSAEA